MANLSHMQLSESVKELLILAQSKDAGHRHTLYNRAAELISEQNDLLTDTERHLVVDILSRLAGHVEMAIRQRLAEKLAPQKDIPHELIELLANDDIEIATPILRECDLLSDPDLIKIIKSRRKNHQCVIATRENISANISTNLVEFGDEDVVVELLKNHTAEIAEETFNYLVEQSERTKSYQGPLINRPDMRPALAEKMYRWVSTALREHIVQKYELDAERIEKELQDSITELQQKRSGEGHKLLAAERLINKLHAAGKLTPSFIVKSLHQNEIPLFELGLAKLTNLPPQTARTFIYEAGGLKLATLCLAIGIDRSAFMSLFDKVRHTKGYDSNISAEEIHALNELLSSHGPKEARAKIQAWLDKDSHE